MEFCGPPTNFSQNIFFGFKFIFFVLNIKINLLLNKKKYIIIKNIFIYILK